MMRLLRPLLPAGLPLLLAAGPAAAQSSGPSTHISLDSLLNVSVSTASRNAQKIRKAPASVTVVTREDIRRWGYRTVAQVLARARGFYTSDDRNYTYLGMRGFSRPTDYNNRVLLLLNGQTLNEGTYGGAYIGTELALDLAVIERIEIVRGPASALYGTSAMLAVINIVTRDGTTVEGIEATAEVGSHGHERGGVVAGGRIGAWDILVAGSLARTDGEDVYFREFDDAGTSDGVASDLDWDRRGGALATARSGDFSIQAFFVSRTKAAPTAAWGTLFDDERFRTRDATAGARIQFEPLLGTGLRLQTEAHADRYDYDGDYPYDGYLYVDSTVATRLGASSQVVWDAAANQRLTVGASIDRQLRADYRAWYEDVQDYLFDQPFTVAGFYAQHEITLHSTLTLTAGARHDHRSDADGATTGRAALLFSPSARRTIKLLYGDAFRAPTPYELNFYAEAPVRPDLRRERINTIELVWEERLAEWLRGEVSVYRYAMDDLIDTVLDEGSGEYYFANRNEVVAPGVEAELEARLDDGTAVWLNWAWQRARLGSTDERLTNSPEHLARLGATTLLHPSVRVMTEAHYEGARITLAGARTSSAVVVRSGIGFEPVPRIQTWLHVENLFDRDYRVPGGGEHVQAALPQPGRSLRLGATVRF